jgi:hypothetical protein
VIEAGLRCENLATATWCDLQPAWWTHQFDQLLYGCADFTKQTQHFLNFNVPRMHQETKPGEAAPCQAESIVGTGVDFEKIGASAHDGEEKIYKYVQEPLRKWLANFDTVVVRTLVSSKLVASISLRACWENLTTPDSATQPCMAALRHRAKMKLHTTPAS